MIPCSLVVVTGVSEESAVSFFRSFMRFRIMTQDSNLGVIQYSMRESMTCRVDIHVECVQLGMVGELAINKKNMPQRFRHMKSFPAAFRHCSWPISTAYSPCSRAICRTGSNLRSITFGVTERG
jgi:hypothetical protein